MTEETKLPKEKKARNSRSLFIQKWWNEDGIKDKAEIAKKLQVIESDGTLPQKKTELVRDEAFYLRVANWYIVQLAKNGKIDYAVKVRKARAPKEEVATEAPATEVSESAPASDVSTSEDSLVPTL